MANYIKIGNNSGIVTYTEDQLIDMVKLRMDEIDNSARQLVDVGIRNNKPITSMIDGLLNESRLDVLKHANQSFVPKVKYTVPSTEMEDRQGHALLVAPADLLRIISVKCDSWKRVATTVYDTTSREYRRQMYDYAKSNVKNPVVIYFDGNTFGLYPYSSGEAAELIYVSSYAVYDDFSEHMINAICWDCASKVFSILGMTDCASKAVEIYKTIID